jgi:hypothetical protein
MPIWLLVAVVIAAPPQRKAATPARPAPAPVQQAPARPAKELLADAKRAYDALDYENVVELAGRALVDPAIGFDDKLVAYQLQGSALSILDPLEAGKPFLLLLTARPDFVLPPETPPKIRQTFAVVKSDFDESRAAREAAERKALAATIDVEDLTPARSMGGRPLRIAWAVGDPRGVVKAVRALYRKRGGGDFAVLPLERDARSGRWTGGVPGEWTANEGGLVVEHGVVVEDAGGVLVERGREAPLLIEIGAGEVEREAPFSPWVVWTSAGVTALAVVASSGATATTMIVDHDYRQRVAAATEDAPADGAALIQTASLGNSMNVAAWVGWGVVGAGALVTGAAALLTNWNAGEDDEAIAAQALE